MSVSKFKEFIAEATKGTAAHIEKLSDDTVVQHWIGELQKAIKKYDWKKAKKAAQVIDQSIDDFKPGN